MGRNTHLSQMNMEQVGHGETYHVEARYGLELWVSVYSGLCGIPLKKLQAVPSFPGLDTIVLALVH
jgi:hypothetical protein